METGYVTIKRGTLRLHLFDLNNDPYEKNNLSKQEPELVERLDKEITHWAESVYSEVPDQLLEKYSARIKITR